MRLTASIVTYKTDPGELNGILSALLADGAEAVYVVDNSPTDELRKIVEAHEGAEYVHRPDNPGYGTAHNVALRKALALNVDYHLVVNSDITFSKGTLPALMEVMDSRPQTAMIQPRVIYPDGREQYSSRLVPGPLDLIFKRLLPPALARRRLDHYLVRHRYDGRSIEDSAGFFPYHQGSFLFFRTSALKEVGLFDERFFMYPEDIDITRRMAARYETLFWPKITIVHCHRAASAHSFRMFAIHAVNMIKYFNKWGWIFDAERRRLNARCLASIEHKRD